MICTHEEAIQKICPILGPGKTLPDNCSGKRCMAWRWHLEEGEGPGYCIIIHSKCWD